MFRVDSLQIQKYTTTSISTTGIKQMPFKYLFFIYSQMIPWPNTERQNEIARVYFQAYGIPGVIGCIDGSPIRLSHCPKGDPDYINRKGFPSLQLQVRLMS